MFYLIFSYVLYRIILLLLSFFLFYVCFCENCNISKKSFHIFCLFCPSTMFIRVFLYAIFFNLNFFIFFYSLPKNIPKLFVFLKYLFLLPKNFNYEIFPCICILGIAFEMCGVDYVSRSITFQYIGSTQSTSK